MTSWLRWGAAVVLWASWGACFDDDDSTGDDDDVVGGDGDVDGDVDVDADVDADGDVDPNDYPRCEDNRLEWVSAHGSDENTLRQGLTLAVSSSDGDGLSLVEDFACDPLWEHCAARQSVSV